MSFRSGRARWVPAGATALVLAGGLLAGTAVAGGAPSHGEDTGSSDAKQAAAPASVKVMTWNVCANSAPRKDDKGQALCANGQTDRVAGGIRWHMQQHEGLHAVLLQEICYADIEKLRTLDGMGGWSFGFSGIHDRGSGSSKGEIRKRQCAKGRGGFGVAVGVKSGDVKFDRFHYATRNVPNARDTWGHWNVKQAGVCADALGTRFCGTHFTPFKGGHGSWDDKKASEFLTSQYGQAEELAAKGKGHSRVVLGGDLNASPQQDSTVTAPLLDPLYGGYKECSQDAAGGDRTGKGTFQNQSGKRGSKLDYVFGNSSAKASCSVTDQHVTLSDHVPVTATVTF
ncbi:endonuclease/exonuclease/phosphatase family protein [Streptomyces nanshensis]|uniref:endonuclease/exonuclease/phosphatase family protein n=1 Tax=Streptomyces nanshensis TaxID=518642 RepID=UPI000AB1A6FA|nr:endonuclease/exonuclease/phosphatase family protein [Streptomyces nanshensis]